jgi:EF hand domain-containing protein
MLKRMNFALVFTVLASALVLVGLAFAQKQPVPKSVDKQALAEDEVKQLLLLMDTDKNGKISKQEWMRFMEAEFDRLDKNESGELDVKEIAQSKLRVSRFADGGK